MPKLDHAKKIIKSQSMVEVIDKYRSFEVGIKALEVDNSKLDLSKLDLSKLDLSKLDFSKLDPKKKIIF